MKSNELRIGNFVEEKGKVKSMYSVSNHNAKDYSKIKPIPLTEDWLLKFGFVQSELNKDWMVKKNITLTKNGTSVCFVNCGTFINLRTYCKHVHQLQNLYFALTGEELIIKN